MYEMSSWGTSRHQGDQQEGSDGSPSPVVAGKPGTFGDDRNSSSNGTKGHWPRDEAIKTMGKGCWTVGLVNSKFKYLSAETFGFRINANGKALKKKQVWMLEPSGDGETVVLKSHLEKYMAVDQFGNVTCDQDDVCDESMFEISVCEDFSGRWAFRSVTRGYYLGASEDMLQCVAKRAGDAELWHVHLAARPLVNLKSVGRKRYAHLSASREEIQVEEAGVPWGEDTLFTLEFVEGVNKYAIATCADTYLQHDGKLSESLNPDCYFSCECHGGHIALRDAKGRYLAPVGSRAALRTRSNMVTKDELFSLEDSLPQASFVAAFNSRYVSVKQGVDVSANQDEISNHETFQLEFDSASQRWHIRTTQDQYLTLQPGGGVQASQRKRSEDGLFQILWHGDGSVSFKASNGKLVGTKKSGHLYANYNNEGSPDVDNSTRFYLYLINRPALVLKCEQGFVGRSSSSSGRLECNKANYEMIAVERSEKGIVYLKGHNGQYVHFQDGAFSVGSEVPYGFFLELRGPTKMCLKTIEGYYVCSAKNGHISASTTDREGATQWEY